MLRSAIDREATAEDHEAQLVPQMTEAQKQDLAASAMIQSVRVAFWFWLWQLALVDVVLVQHQGIHVLTRSPPRRDGAVKT